MKKVCLAIIVFSVAILACGGETTGQVVSTTAPGQPTATAGVAVYGVGEVIQVKDHTIVLNSVEVKGGEIICNFTIENKGKAEMNVSSMMSFNARNQDGEKLEGDIMCDNGLGGKILSGDKMKGNVCWKAASKVGVKIYYTPELFGSGAIVWKLE